MNREELQNKVDAIRWFHQIDLGQGIITPGLDDSQAKLGQLRFPERFTGQSVLDVGAWDGFFSFEAERRGASHVLAVDSYSWTGDGWGNKSGFELARQARNSKVLDRELDVFDLSPDTVGTFDVVLFLGVLYHLRHPLLALEKIASVTRNQLILETAADLLWCKTPAVAFYQGDELNSDPTNWWAPNIPALCGMLRAVGFQRVEVVSQPKPWYVRVAKSLRRGKVSTKELQRGRLAVHAWR